MKAITLNKRTFLMILAGVAILLVIGLFFATHDVKARVPDKYIIDQESCDQKICVTPTFISEDRMSAVLLVYSKETNMTCLQRIEEGVLVPLKFYDCQEGKIGRWDPESSGGIKI